MYTSRSCLSRVRVFVVLGEKLKPSWRHDGRVHSGDYKDHGSCLLPYKGYIRYTRS